VFAYLRTLKTWHCPHLLLSAVLLPRRPCSDRDRHLQPAGTTAANPPHAAAADEWYRHTDRQTDRTDTVPFYRPRSAYYAGSANNVQVPYVGIRFPSKTKCRPVGCEKICPPSMAVRRWQKSRRIYVRPRTGPQSAHLWWQAVAKLQAASVPIA